jgi:putative copper export protein
VEQFVLFLHIVAASVWVGGQIVVAGLVPTVRGFGEDAPKALAAAFNRVAWPAFGLAVLTGLVNVLLMGMDELAHPLIEIKVMLVLFSAVGAVVHQTANGNKARLAGGGAVALLFGLGAMYAGVLLG